MADNEKPRRPHFPRKNPNLRPPPGVQKAINNFGVKDLRQILDKKHEGETLEEKQIDRRKLPPPDPSYNYLRDPARDVQPPPKKDERKNTKTRPNPVSNQNHNNKDDSPKKEVHFKEESSIKGRGSRRYGPGRHGGKEKIENPFNIKIELNTETDKRSCVLDESVKIPDLKHVPDHPPHKPRGGYRGGRNSFRGRGRGRGSVRNRGGYTNNTSSEETSKQDYDESDENEYPENKVDEEIPKSEFDSQIAETITITSSKFEDGECVRSVNIEENVENTEN